MPSCASFLSCRLERMLRAEAVASSPQSPADELRPVLLRDAPLAVAGDREVRARDELRREVERDPRVTVRLALRHAVRDRRPADRVVRETLGVALVADALNVERLVNERREREHLTRRRLEPAMDVADEVPCLVAVLRTHRDRLVPR